MMPTRANQLTTALKIQTLALMTSRVMMVMSWALKGQRLGGREISTWVYICVESAHNISS
jgi:hypothetical protein